MSGAVLLAAVVVGYLAFMALASWLLWKASKQ